MLDEYDILHGLDDPKPTQEEVSQYLDDLRESAETNMFGAVPYILREYPMLTKAEAKAYLIHWMEHFGDEV